MLTNRLVLTTCMKYNFTQETEDLMFGNHLCILHVILYAVMRLLHL